MANQENLPRPAPEVVEDGVPAIEELPEAQLLTGDPLEGELPPLDRPQAATDWGTTAAEQLASEPLELRALREEPEVGTDEVRAGGQVLEPGAEGGIADVEPDAVGELDTGLEDTLSPEEAAMRVEDEPAGLTYDDDPGYLDPDEGRL